nr:AlNc14C164G7846 [Albugo laibachii Nc14]|eukprot:CCA22701.1 AlNc14C164G7846 [Albugo laibachii Nc14]
MLATCMKRALIRERVVLIDIRSHEYGDSKWYLGGLQIMTLEKLFNCFWIAIASTENMVLDSSGAN